MDVSSDNFLNVLMGRTMNVGSKKTLKTGPNDRLFIYFADHGGPGMSQFGNGTHGILHATNLTDTIMEMHKQNKYKEMVLYWESCESGSMFQNLSSDINVYALSASNSTQSSWACYCNRTGMTPCYGDCFSVHWMEDADDEDLRNETLLIQFWITRHETNINRYNPMEVSHVKQWGSVKKMNREKVAKYMGSKSVIDEGQSSSGGGSISFHDEAGNDPGIAIPQPEVARRMLEMKLKNAKLSGVEKEAVAQKLKNMMENRENVQLKINKIVESSFDLAWRKLDKVNGRGQFGESKMFEENPNVQLSRSQYENCFYHIIQMFGDKCFSLTCNDYVFYQMKMFVPLCNEGIALDVVTQAMNVHCEVPTNPICGIY